MRTITSSIFSKYLSRPLRKAAWLVVAPLSMSVMAAPVDLNVPEADHKRYNEAALLDMLCARIKTKSAPITGIVPLDTDLCIPGEMRHNTQLKLEQVLDVEHEGKRYEVQILTSKMPTVRSEQIEWYVKINDEYLWFAQSRRNLQRSEQFTIKLLAHNPDQNLLSIDIESKIYFPPSPEKKYDFIVRRYILDLNTEKPMFWLYAMPMHQWQNWIHRGPKKDLTSLFFSPATGELVLSGDQIYGQQSRWLESDIPELPSKKMNTMHPANQLLDADAPKATVMPAKKETR
jgi:hypothetical protein